MQIVPDELLVSEIVTDEMLVSEVVPDELLVSEVGLPVPVDVPVKPESVGNVTVNVESMHSKSFISMLWSLRAHTEMVASVKINVISLTFVDPLAWNSPYPVRVIDESVPRLDIIGIAALQVWSIRKTRGK